MSSPYLELYSALTERFKTVLKIIDGSISPKELVDVTDLVSANEFGLALETLAWIIEQGNKAIPRRACDEIICIAEMMKLDTSQLSLMLAKHAK